MTVAIENHFELLVHRYPQLMDIREDFFQGFELIRQCFCSGGKLLIAGNGGSAADAEHIVGELMKSFLIPDCPDEDFETLLKAVDGELGSELAEGLQHALPAIALNSHPALSTAFLNDCDPYMTFAQQVYGLGKSEDVLLCISTSGNSKNILYAAVVAKAKGIPMISLTGASGGEVSRLSDVCIKAPETETFKIQELHLPIYHCLCAMLEEAFFK